MYLFKRASDNKWIFGPTTECEHPSLHLKVVPTPDQKQIMIKSILDELVFNPIPFSSFLKENGTPYASFAELKAGYDGFFASSGAPQAQIVDAGGKPFNVGVCNGCVDATLSDTVDLANPGYIQPRLLAGNIKVTDVNGNVSTLAFDAKEVSLFRVKRVWSAGTTPNMGIVVLY